MNDSSNPRRSSPSLRGKYVQLIKIGNRLSLFDERLSIRRDAEREDEKNKEMEGDLRWDDDDGESGDSRLSGNELIVRTRD